MKRKRGSGRCNAKKPSVLRAADISVDPGFYSDTNEENNGIEYRTENETREVNYNFCGQSVGLDTPVTNNNTVGGAASKLAWAMSSSRPNLTSDRFPLQRERVGQKEPKSSWGHPVYNKQDLDAAQSVIKKIMKMDAAVPFNAPVDPIALGIPDYFDIIDTPMDFGTICSKLENGLKYRNSGEVLDDVELIWDNCCKYNKKGSYIVDLMKRVKTNFMKQWTAAGLYKEQQTVNNGHLSQNPQVLAEPRHEETGHLNPVGSIIRRSAYLQEHESQRQHQQLSNCCSHSLKPQQISCCSHTQNDLAPQQNSSGHLLLVNLMNGKSCSQWVNEAGPSPVQSSRPSPSCSFMRPPKQRPFMHHSSSSHLPPSQLQSGIKAQGAGHLHLPGREHALRSGQDANNRYDTEQYQVGPVHMQDNQPSASCMPVHQPYQCVSHLFQSSHIDGSRNIDFAGNMDNPPPTESTANCTKRGTDKTSCQNLNQINTTHEQSSSSMANTEPCQPLEKTCQNQLKSSMLECSHSRADNNFSKRKTRSQGLMQCQEQSSSMMNGTDHHPPKDTSQVKTVSPKSRSSPPNAGLDRKLKKVPRGRGPTIDIDGDEERIPVTTNGQGQAVGPEAQKLVTFLGTLARNGHYLPLTYLDWRAVPFETKEKMWEKVQLRFDIDPVSKDWVLQSLSRRWKDWKSKLKTAHYNPYETNAERLADRDERVLPDQWAALVELWSSESMQKCSARNRANRMQAKYIHAAGRKSFAQIREEQRVNRPDGKEPSRAELFILTRTGKNGKPINDASSEVIKQLWTKDKDTPGDNNKQDDMLSEIIGPDKKGRTRCIELGTSPSDLGGLKPAAKKMVYEANSEIREMKEKMAVMEQTCAQMASQMAAMMSMMSSMHKNVPSMNAIDTAASASAASDHSLPHLPHTKQTTRQTRRSSKRHI